MIRRICACLSCLILAFSLLSQPAFSQDSAANLDARFEALLQKFDPKAVEAAKSYSKNFNIKQQLEQSTTAMIPGLLKQLQSKNQNLSQEDGKLVFEEFMRVALIEFAPVIEKWTMLNMLEIFNTEEIVAMDSFYGSPIGKSILAKFPTLMGKMPEMITIMQRNMVPAGLAAAQAKLRAAGKELKL